MNKINVSTLVRYLKNKLDSDNNLNNIYVCGELSNFKRHSSGHLYFTLKDEKSAINCVMFSSKANTLKFEPKSGDKVVAYASASIFETTGQLQLYVNSLKLDGLGDLYQQYEELKNKLAKEGYFSEEHKIAISTDYPERIAVLVGDNSAALSDIKIQFNRRWPLCKVDIYPVLVQGNDAPKDIIENLIKVDELNYDAIILARGGGSFEDLFAFNDEELVKTIYHLKTFIISGIGHEQDFTLSDFVADLRAPTPTATVELITPNIDDVIQVVDVKSEQIIYLFNQRIDNITADLNNLINNKYFLNPGLLIEKVELKINNYLSNLNNFSLLLKNYLIKIANLKKELKDKLKYLINKKETLIEHNNKLLNAYSYSNTLKRGYSVVYKDNHLITSKRKLNKNDEINIEMYDGKIIANVKEA